MTDNTNQSSVPTPTALQPPVVEISQATSNDNPLAPYFRVPKIQMELPTKGKFYPEGSLKLKEDGFLDVMSMTARDEIIMKSPEGLLSGSSVVETIESCMPGIKNAYTMPSHDVDACLIAIRIASYGPQLKITTTCPHCQHVNEDIVDLRLLLDSIPKGTIQHIHNIGDLTFEFAPYDWNFVNTNNKRTFEAEQKMKSLNAQEMADDEKRTYLKAMFDKMTVDSLDSISVGIDKINTKEGKVVGNKAQIQEFIRNADRDLIEAIRQKISIMNDAVAYPPITLTCEECEKTQDKPVEFNQSTFFE